MNFSILKYISKRSRTLYFSAIAVVAVLFMTYFMKWYWVAFGLVSVVGFFSYAPKLALNWSRYSPAFFEKKLFRTALMIRIIYVIISYLFYLGMNGVPYEFGAADVFTYNALGEHGARLISSGNFNFVKEFENYAGVGISDCGYAIYLSFIYFITSNSILIARICKAILSAWTCVIMYRVAARNFEENVARVAAIFCLLMPNLIYYCGIHLKETEMLFMTVLFIERADLLLRQKQTNVKLIITVVILGLLLFTFRTVLGIVAFLALFSALVLSSKRIIKTGKRIIIGFFITILLGISFSNKISEEVSTIIENSSTNQSKSMAWRAEREGGNSLAKYATGAIFAPLIFTIPFPTVVETPGQENQRMIHGGNFVKNITSFFTIFALFSLLFNGEWRKHVLPAAFMCGYLLVIALSAFAQSERFHLPALPFALMFASYGISQFRMKHKKWFNMWWMLIFVAFIAWSWFKLAGRGL